jgi:hypothetical protein
LLQDSDRAICSPQRRGVRIRPAPPLLSFACTVFGVKRFEFGALLVAQHASPDTKLIYRQRILALSLENLGDVITDADAGVVEGDEQIKRGDQFGAHTKDHEDADDCDGKAADTDAMHGLPPAGLLVAKKGPDEYARHPVFN